VRFTYADGRMPVSMTKSGITYYLAYDQIGSLRAVMDSTGTVVKELLYDSFGSIIYESNPTFTMPLGFAGGLHDRDTGLVRFGYRDYDPTIGRWTAKDPIDFAGGDLNLFGYVGNNPVNWIDPWGLQGAVMTPAGPMPLLFPIFPQPTPQQVQQSINTLTNLLNPMPLINYLLSKSKPGSKPKGCPTGTKPIDQYPGLDKDDIHNIKDGVNAGPKDWTGITPDGNVVTGDADGNAVVHDPYGQYLP
jgi:RHS repeat-associated protein